MTCISTTVTILSWNFCSQYSEDIHESICINTMSVAIKFHCFKFKYSGTEPADALYSHWSHLSLFCMTNSQSHKNWTWSYISIYLFVFLLEIYLFIFCSFYWCSPWNVPRNIPFIFYFHFLLLDQKKREIFENFFQTCLIITYSCWLLF